MAARRRSIDSIVITVALTSGLALMLADRFLGGRHGEALGRPAAGRGGEVSACFDESSRAIRLFDLHQEACAAGERTLYWFPGNSVGTESLAPLVGPPVLLEGPPTPVTGRSFGGGASAVP